MPRRVQRRKKVTAWSFSALKEFRECPRRFFYKKIMKYPEGSQGRALIKGKEVHKEAEIFLKSKKGDVPHSCELFTEEFEALRELRASSEASWAFTEDWTPCSWFDSDNPDGVKVWVRVMLDAYHTMTIDLPRKKNAPAVKVIDFKTGKLREGYGEQLDLYALSAFKKFPDVDVVIPELWFLDEGILVGGPDANQQMSDVKPMYVRSRDEKKLETKFRREPTKMLEMCAAFMAEKDYPQDGSTVDAQPGFYCRWCPYSTQENQSAASPMCEMG